VARLLNKESEGLEENLGDQIQRKAHGMDGKIIKIAVPRAKAACGAPRKAVTLLGQRQKQRRKGGVSDVKQLRREVSPRRLVANQMVTSGQCSHRVSAQPDVK
jgi:hypothetical protein